MIIEKSCGAVVYRKLGADIEFLAVRSKGNDGHWGFPKGHVEKGESEEETALREIQEETGLKVTILDGFKTKMEYSLAENIHKEVIFFIGRATEEEVSIQEEEIEAYKWLNYNEMLHILTFENAKDVLKEAHECLQEVL